MSSKEPYTERPNGLTENIDKIGNARSVVRLLKAVDAQLFGGYIGEHPGLGDFETAKVIPCEGGFPPFFDLCLSSVITDWYATLGF